MRPSGERQSRAPLPPGPERSRSHRPRSRGATRAPAVLCRPPASQLRRRRGRGPGDHAPGDRGPAGRAHREARLSPLVSLPNRPARLPAPLPLGGTGGQGAATVWRLDARERAGRPPRLNDLGRTEGRRARGSRTARRGGPGDSDADLLGGDVDRRSRPEARHHRGKRAGAPAPGAGTPGPAPRCNAGGSKGTLRMHMKEIDCTRADETDLVALYLAGKLPEHEAEAFETHYLGCERCAAALREGGEIRAALGKPVLATAPASPEAPRRGGSRDVWTFLAAAAAVAAFFYGLGHVA